MALITTVGADDAQSYADAAFATAFFTSLGLATEWSTYATDAEATLLRAMDAIEARDYMGSRANNEAGSSIYQALEFPRKSTFYLGAMAATDGTTWTDLRGRRYTDAENPTPIKQAQCWEAMAIAVDEYRLANESGDAVEFRTVSIVIKQGSGSDLTQKINRARSEANRLLSPFLASMNGRTSRT